MREYASTILQFIGSGQAWDTGNPGKAKASEQCMTRRGLHVYQMGGQIKDLDWNRRDAVSRSTVGVWRRVWFANESPTC